MYNLKRSSHLQPQENKKQKGLKENVLRQNTRETDIQLQLDLQKCHKTKWV